MLTAVLLPADLHPTYPLVFIKGNEFATFSDSGLVCVRVSLT